MCGIGGLITNYPFDRDEGEICHDLMDSLVRRGTDAWGFFDGHTVHKAPGPFYESDFYDRLPTYLIGNNIFLGHTRKVTRGNPQKNKNNHPFWLDPFVFAHNGSFFYTEKFKDKWDIDTDSFWLLYWIWRNYNKSGDVVTSIQEGVKKVAGGYACWLYNFDDDSVYLFRNHKRPTMTIYVERDKEGKGKGILFGSDARSITEALGTENILAIPIFPGKIYRIKDGKIDQVGTFKGRKMTRIEELKYYRIHGEFLDEYYNTLEFIGEDEEI